MSEILLILLLIALAWQWRRVSALERRMRDLEAGVAPPATHPRHLAHEAPAFAQELPPASVREPLPPPQETAVAIAAATTARPATRWRPIFDFEELFGRQLPIWGGGIALAVAGFFLVRYSIESGMLGPWSRVALSFGAGAALLAAAELAHRLSARLDDDRVRQALAGAGLATLYAGFYLGGTLYQLFAPALAFAGLAGVTALAIGLSWRFGLPTAVLGLVGGFAAPALAGATEPNLPLLASYLALVTGGLVVTGDRQGRQGLGLAALAGGLLWGAALLVDGGALARNEAVLSIGLYLVLLGAVLPHFAGEGRLGQVARIAAGALATVQIALLVDRSNYGLLAWGCYLLLGAALAVLGWRHQRLREAGAMAAGVSACLLAAWSQPEGWTFVGIAAAAALIFGGPPLAQVWRGTAAAVDRWQLALYPLAVGAATLVQFDVAMLEARSAGVALAAILLALLPLAGWWRDRDTAGGVAAALLVQAALALLLPDTWLPLILAAAAVPLAWRISRAEPIAITLLLLAAVWAAQPLVYLAGAGLAALHAEPVLLSDLPDMRLTWQQLAPLAVAWAAALMLQPSLFGRLRRGAWVIAATLLLAVAHLTFKQLFALNDPLRFAALGMAERTLWQVVLAGAGVALVLRTRLVTAGRVLGWLALAHFSLFTLLLHNPLWSEQAVGAIPVLNLLLPAYALATVLVLWLRSVGRARRVSDAAAMLLVAVGALSLLRQSFSGTILLQPLGAGEDLLRSLLAIALALAFLGWGARTGQRSWRVGSLVLMLGAVLKVFILDAAALDGLARIGSFFALGICLIGIGWFYSRQLRGSQAATQPDIAPATPRAKGTRKED
ncbi:DUF2339 domain-containing protein [Croceibacterium ferulae]|uniref:DUF2339 domain-containing protein n=1 Tax=Croceibacterium ferulae TaxID=1854641 RepID=UPI000F88D7AB|nr:DUF2339 domain-containing protein [Croceibacterium ferulae]